MKVKMISAALLASIAAVGILPTAVPGTASSGIPGDVNADGIFNDADVAAVQKWLLNGTSELKDWNMGDWNGDGVLNGFDLGFMKRALLEGNSEQTGRHIRVASVEELFHAVRNALPGDVIAVAPGTYDYTIYQGAQKMDTSAAGTADAPITLIAEDPKNPPVLTGTSAENGYVLQIMGDYWILDTLCITTSQKGIVLDHSNHTIIRNCDIGNTGSEAVAIRDGSSYCLVQNCVIHDSGVVTPGYGEGVYIGSSYTVTGFDYKCDYTVVEGCTFWNIAAEHIDVKEYTTGTEIAGCTFYGDGMSGANYAGSFIDIAGNNCYVHDNTGYRNHNANIVAAFEIHEQVEGWGYHNVFENNTLYMDREYGEVDTSRRMYVVDGWFSDFTVSNNLVDYGNGLIEALPEHYNSDTVTFAPSTGSQDLSGKLLFHSYSDYEARDSQLKVYDFSNQTLSVIQSDVFYHAMNGDFGNSANDIVFMAITKSTDTWNIYRYHADSGVFDNLTEEGNFRNEDPKFSPDGSKVVFKRGYWDDTADDFIYNLAEIELSSGTITMLTDDSVEESMPYYSSDGTCIYHCRGTGQDSGIYVVNPATGVCSEVYDRENVQDYYPIVSDDTVYFAGWLSEQCHSDGIFWMQNGEVTSLPCNAESYNCSDPFPVNGTQLLFSGTQNGDYDLFLYDGKQIQALDMLNTDVHELGAAYFS